MDLAPDYLPDALPVEESPLNLSFVPEISIFWIFGVLLLVIHYGFIWFTKRMTKSHCSIHLANMISLAITKSAQDQANTNLKETISDTT